MQLFEFTERANGVHNNKYDYSQVVYKNNKTKVIIICPIHGEFTQLPKDHLNGQGCPKCANKGSGRNGKKTKWEYLGYTICF